MQLSGNGGIGFNRSMRRNVFMYQGDIDLCARVMGCRRRTSGDDI